VRARAPTPTRSQPTRERVSNAPHMASPLHAALLDAATTFGTPLYAYDGAAVDKSCRALSAAFPGAELLYAVKANSNPALLRRILNSSPSSPTAAPFGLDCVSLGEVLLALLALADRPPPPPPGQVDSGVLPPRATTILYTNNGVSREEWDTVVALAAASQGLPNANPVPLPVPVPPGTTIYPNIDSLQRVHELPPGLQCFARVNGPVGGGHHAHVITCGPASKFGIPWEDLPALLAACAEKGVRLVGLHQHIGSGILDAATLLQAADVLFDVIRGVAAGRKRSVEGVAPPLDLPPHPLPDLRFVNVGGGIGVPYRPFPHHEPLDLGAYARGLFERMRRLEDDIWGRDDSPPAAPPASSPPRRRLTLMLEPGRFVVAESGYLLTRVSVVKPTPYGGRVYVGVDTGFHHLLRPTLYGSYHHITNLSRTTCAPLAPFLVSGNICESGDVFTRHHAGLTPPLPVDAAADEGSDGEGPGLRLLPAATGVGDVLALHTVGAYGYSMSSEYNTRPRPAEVLLLPVAGGGEGEGEGERGYEARVIRRGKTALEIVREARRDAGLE
jgi:diaminopimelate decarboxylase